MAPVSAPAHSLAHPHYHYHYHYHCSLPFATHPDNTHKHHHSLSHLSSPSIYILHIHQSVPLANSLKSSAWSGCHRESGARFLYMSSAAHWIRLWSSATLTCRCRCIHICHIMTAMIMMRVRTIGMGKRGERWVVVGRSRRCPGRGCRTGWRRSSQAGNRPPAMANDRRHRQQIDMRYTDSRREDAPTKMRTRKKKKTHVCMYTACTVPYHIHHIISYTLYHIIYTSCIHCTWSHVHAPSGLLLALHSAILSAPAPVSFAVCALHECGCMYVQMRMC